VALKILRYEEVVQLIRAPDTYECKILCIYEVLANNKGEIMSIKLEV